jgi:hypothetical protein
MHLGRARMQLITPTRTLQAASESAPTGWQGVRRDSWQPPSGAVLLPVRPPVGPVLPSARDCVSAGAKTAGLPDALTSLTNVKT